MESRMTGNYFDRGDGDDVYVVDVVLFFSVSGTLAPASCLIGMRIRLLGECDAR